MKEIVIYVLCGNDILFVGFKVSSIMIALGLGLLLNPDIGEGWFLNNGLNDLFSNEEGAGFIVHGVNNYFMMSIISR